LLLLEPDSFSLRPLFEPLELPELELPELPELRFLSSSRSMENSFNVGPLGARLWMAGPDHRLPLWPLPRLLEPLDLERVLRPPLLPWPLLLLLERPRPPLLLLLLVPLGISGTPYGLDHEPNPHSGTAGALSEARIGGESVRACGSPAWTQVVARRRPGPALRVETATLGSCAFC
jgi:hypothetical protein